jgi:hypothetical protein
MYFGNSPYGYVRNNPILRIDPNGMSDLDINGDPRYDPFTGMLIPPSERGKDKSLSGRFVADLSKLISDVFSTVLETEKAPDGKTITSVDEDVNAVAQGPVAIIIVGNVVAQTIVGGMDASGGVIMILSGKDKGTYAIADLGAPWISSAFSAGVSVQVMPVFFKGAKEDFRIKHVEGTRYEVNGSIPGTPVTIGGFNSATSKPHEATFGIYVGVGKTISIKGLKDTFQSNIGGTKIYK